jgi:hypothetical protein
MLIPLPPQGVQNADVTWHSVVGTVLSTHLSPDNTGHTGTQNDLTDSTDNIILFWRPGLGIIQNNLLSLKFHIAHTRFVKFLIVHSWGNPPFDHSMTQEISKITWRFWINTISMICRLSVFIQSETNYGNTLSAMSIAFGSLMICISCSWV